jgi:hypothetical protein
MVSINNSSNPQGIRTVPVIHSLDHSETWVLPIIFLQPFFLVHESVQRLKGAGDSYFTKDTPKIAKQSLNKVGPKG